MKKTLFISLLATSVVLASCGSAETTDDSATNDETSEQSNDENSDETSYNSEQEEELSRKQELLTSLIGDYTLESIEGMMGVNTMVDYSIHDAQWLANGSSNSGGTREAYPIELDNEDQKRLNSYQITVTEDLTVKFSVGGKEYVSVPFSEEMTMSLANPVDDYSSVITEGLSGSTTFINNNLYLFAKDGYAERALEGADELDVASDAVMLTYDEDSKSFELSIFYADCCDTGIYTFK